jgi:hypothetical protein
MDPESARRAYREQAAETGRLLHATESALRRLAAADEARTAAYAAVEAEWGRLDSFERRAAGIWTELTNRFGSDATGPLPEPAEQIKPGLDAEVLLHDAHRQVRQPVDHTLTTRYVAMAALGFAAAVLVSLLGLELAGLMDGLGRTRLLAAYGPVAVAPYIGRLTATAWIKFRTAHEEKEYAVDTAIGGTLGGGGVWAIALIVLVARLVT